MVTLLLDSTQLEVVLGPVERALSFRRRNVEVPRHTIVRVQLTDDAWTWLRGVPNPGTNLPIAVGMGTWKSAGGNDFVLIRGRRPSVVIDLEGHDEFERVVLTTQHGVALVQALRLDGDDELTDVVDIAPPAKTRKRPTPKSRPTPKPGPAPKS